MAELIPEKQETEQLIYNLKIVLSAKVSCWNLILGSVFLRNAKYFSTSRRIKTMNN